jgi:glutaredoxin 3
MHITVYSTPSCPYCKLAKDFLHEKGVTYTEIDVANDPQAANDMVKKSGQMGVPVIEIDGEIVIGWNQKALEDLLKSSSKAKVKNAA